MRGSITITPATHPILPIFSFLAEDPTTALQRSDASSVALVLVLASRLQQHYHCLAPHVTSVIELPLHLASPVYIV